MDDENLPQNSSNISSKYFFTDKISRNILTYKIYEDLTIEEKKKIKPLTSQYLFEKFRKINHDRFEREIYTRDGCQA